jgi:molybdenum cofactor cytidylyltransferase
MVSAVILASGYGKRMGRNKLLMPFKGKPLVEHVIDEVLKCDFNDVILVAREEEVIELGKNKDLKIIINKEAHKGQSQSVKLGVLNSCEAEAYMFFTGDQPFINKELIEKLITNFTQNKDFIIVPRHEGGRGNPVIFPGKFKEELLNLEGDQGGRVIIQKYIDKVHFVDIEEKDLFLDIDTPEDYEKLINIKYSQD